MASPARVICEAAELAEGGMGVRFSIDRDGQRQAAFAVRWRGTIHAYLNRCAHIPVELDWAEGEFFDLSKLYLICSTHGAMYDPLSGKCIAGPCKGQNLVPLRVEETDGKVYLVD